jgi:hypothetical protein
MHLQNKKLLAMNGVLCVLFAAELGFLTWSAIICGVLCGGTGDCSEGCYCNCEAPEDDGQAVSDSFSLILSFIVRIGGSDSINVRVHIYISVRRENV